MGAEAAPRPPPPAVPSPKVAVHERPRTAAPARLDQSAARSAPSQTQAPAVRPRYKVAQDCRKKLPSFLRRWTGYRPPDDAKPPHKPLPFPPFTWLAKLPLKYETWILSTIGAFVGIALLEVIISAAFPNDGTILIVASFGASAVLCFGTIESPLAQPRHVIGGQVFSCVLSVALTRLFRKASGYELSDVVIPGELNHVVWINGALCMALSLLLMQITGTVHPPGGATALIASVQPAAVAMSWRLIYVVLIQSLIMTVWACIINNVGRRRYPTYWFSGTHSFVRPPVKDEPANAPQEKKPLTVDQSAMAAEEGRSASMSMADGQGVGGEQEDAPRASGFAGQGFANGSGQPYGQDTTDMNARATLYCSRNAPHI